jgi:hypothetical protein
MSNPNDPWSRRPEEHSPGDQPTQEFGTPTEQSHTADPHQAYGGAYPPGQGYPQQPYPGQSYPEQSYPGPGYPPPTNPTMAYPTYEGAYATNPGQYPGEVPPLEQEPGGPRRKTGLLIAGLVVVILAAIAGAAFLLAGSDSDESTTQASGDAVPTRVLPPSASALPPPTPEPGAPSEEPIPGLGDAFGDFGVAMGTITKIEGWTVEIEDMIGDDTTTIRTDNSTEVVTPDGNEISDLKVGEQVAAQGEKNSDGTFQAKVLVSMALPDLGEFGDFGGFGR